MKKASDSSFHAICLAASIAVTILLLFPAAKVNAQEISLDAFQPLPIAHHITDMALTEDGLYLVMISTDSDLVSVWDVKAEKMKTEVACLKPAHILCRGDRVYISNQGLGTISVLSQADDFKIVDELLLKQKKINRMSAPEGKYFRGDILVTGEIDRDTYVNYVVNTAKDTCTPIPPAVAGKSIPVYVNYTGTLVIEAKVAYSPNSAAYGYADFLSGGKLPLTYDIPVFNGLTWPMRPIHGSNLWTHNKNVYPSVSHDILICPGKLSPHFTGGSRNEGTIAVDHKGQYCFFIEVPFRQVKADDQAECLIEARPLISPYHVSSSRTILVPQGLRRTPQTFPLAVTHEDKLYFFFVDDQREQKAWRLTTAAFEPPAAGKPIPLGTPPVVGKVDQLTPGLNGRSLLMLTGDWLSELTPDGSSMIRKLMLPTIYNFIHEREGYFIAGGLHGIDLLDRKTGSLLRHIALPGIGPLSMACHPQRPITYVSIEEPEQPTNYETRRILCIVNEKTGAASIASGILAEKVHVDAQGKRLIVASKEKSEPVTKRVQGHLAYGTRRVSTYDLTRSLKLISTVDDQSLLLNVASSADGQAICFATSGPFRGSKEKVDIHNPANLTKALSVRPATEGQRTQFWPIMVAFHPSRPLMAILSDRDATFCNIEIYDLKEKQFVSILTETEEELQMPKHMIFSPDGTKLLIVHRNSLSGLLRLTAIPLKEPAVSTSGTD